MDNEIKEIENENETENKRQNPPSYHVVYHAETGIELRSFFTKRELTKHIRSFRPESLIGLFKGKKLHATIVNDYSIM